MSGYHFRFAVMSGRTLYFYSESREARSFVKTTTNRTRSSKRISAEEACKMHHKLKQETTAHYLFQMNQVYFLVQAEEAEHNFACADGEPADFADKDEPLVSLLKKPAAAPKALKDKRLPATPAPEDPEAPATPAPEDPEKKKRKVADLFPSLTSNVHKLLERHLLIYFTFSIPDRWPARPCQRLSRSNTHFVLCNSFLSLS